MPPLAALIFDVDGTLAETEEMHRLAFNQAFAAAGLDWHWDQALYRVLLDVTGGKERIRHFMPTTNAARGSPPIDVRALHAAKTEHYTALMRGGGISLRPGIARLLAEAHAAGLRLAIATTTSRPNVDALLRAAPALPPFEIIVAGDEVAAKKPAPDVYLLALEGLGLAANQCIAFEDTVNGLSSAQGAGLRCVLTKSVYGGDGPFPGAAIVVDDLDAAPRIDIRALNALAAGG
jgi:HAD superfamily hydrolase (TIGR01509 family)